MSIGLPGLVKLSALEWFGPVVLPARWCWGRLRWCDVRLVGDWAVSRFRVLIGCAIRTGQEAREGEPLFQWMK